MRNKRYVKKGMIIEVQIRDEYYASANIMQTNKEKTEFTVGLSIHDTESGFTEELDKYFSITYDGKNLNADITFHLNKMIDEGFFDEDVAALENLIDCMNSLLELKKKLREVE